MKFKLCLVVFHLVLILLPEFISIDTRTPRQIKLDDAWHEWKDRFNKTYTDFIARYKKIVWEINYDRIEKHNLEAQQGRHNFTLRMNHLADLSLREYLRKMVVLSSSRRFKFDDQMLGLPLVPQGSLPESLDWREKGFITPPWNQKDCGSCYAFSVAASIQAQIFKLNGSMERLSEQQLVDCSISFGNMGCNGGSLRNTLKYVEQYGLMRFDDYPYVSKQSFCRYKSERVRVRLAAWSVLPARDELSLKHAVATVGPIPVSINASPHTFMFYHTGIYDDITCTADSVNHAMLLVGYTPQAWILKNWWSDKWGDRGYMYIARGKNRCGIANFAVFSNIMNF